MSKPTPKDVANRLLILKYQIVYALALPPNDILHDLLSKQSNKEKEQFIKTLDEHSEQIINALKELNLWAYMTNDEKEFLSSKPTNVNLQQHINAMWQMEAVAVLMWAVGLIKELPPFDIQTDPDLLKMIPYEDTEQFINSVVLLTDEEIEKKRSLAELWHWRGRTRQLLGMGNKISKKLGSKSLDEIISEVTKEAVKQGDLLSTIDNDFVAKGKAYRDLTEDEWSEVMSITIERHRGLNWLCGYATENKWDEIPTDT